ncbi:MAG TPA: addiction module antidote protein, HigA family [Parvularcula sp.]|nr:addiction module antidote protein, HigA family [Parvularcula sp.]
MSVLKIAVHPGRILREEFMEPFGLSPIAIARHIDVPRTRIERLAREETAITVDTATRLAAAFKTSAAFWMNLQTAYDLLTAPTVKGVKPIPAIAGQGA